MLTRKGFLVSAGGVAVVGGLWARGWQNGLVGTGDQARELWRSWRELPAPMSLVAAGVLAASPHNTQPWLFRLRGETIELAVDERKALGPVDPFGRQLWLGVGCAVENIVAAGAGIGRAVTVAPLADNSSALQLSLGAPIAARPEMLDRISRRHTNRNPYHPDRPVERPLVDELSSLGTDTATRLDVFARGDSRGRDFAAATVDATRALIADGDFMRESDRWFRVTPREENDHRDGPSLRCSGLPRWKRVVSGFAPRLGEAAQHQGWLTLTTERHCGTAASFGAISVRDVDHRQLVEAGRLWQRLQLAATARGLGFQPLDQLLEVSDRDRQLGREASAERRLASLTDSGWRPVLTFRLGWPQAEAPASARRPLSSFVLA